MVGRNNQSSYTFIIFSLFGRCGIVYLNNNEKKLAGRSAMDSRMHKEDRPSRTGNHPRHELVEDKLQGAMWSDSKTSGCNT